MKETLSSRTPNDGIKHEISYDAIIRNNIVAGNGGSFDEWLWGSQILVQNSSNVEVYGNFVEVAAGSATVSVSSIRTGARSRGLARRP